MYSFFRIKMLFNSCKEKLLYVWDSRKEKPSDIIKKVLFVLRHISLMRMKYRLVWWFTLLIGKRPKFYHPSSNLLRLISTLILVFYVVSSGVSLIIRYGLYALNSVNIYFDNSSIRILILFLKTYYKKNISGLRLS